MGFETNGTEQWKSIESTLKLEVASRKPEAGRQNLEVGNRKWNSEVGRQNLEVRNPTSEVGRQTVKVRGWKSEVFDLGLFSNLNFSDFCAIFFIFVTNFLFTI